ncbi:hypothetical protein FVEN_g5967 [Fusarium venenatum]|uniref:Uncharacterized protein n=1 Tax=Fusarium venenatum TaxID=56646 RepID=A0A2L2T1I8_9HYPO|nr:uncharacterized protein FVRRES_05749 [Fusarium venenatum]KAG8356095.1 hypothetical protein FVEN_g5967 [Fusarium venenatum]KAH6992798.1 hypothetical protein EDB82DRAFT_554839 [Fusarium venenatum]CEI61313.1 unnamed protein product [Fusarium venenatum]
MTRIIVKRKSQPSSPIQSSASLSVSAPSSPESARKYSQIKLRLYRGAKECPICKATIVDRNGSMERHVERHVKLAEIEALNDAIEPKRSDMSESDIAIAVKLWQSLPANLRATGGVFRDGPLANKGEVSGMPTVFMTNGRLKKKYMWIRKNQEGRVGRRPLKNLKSGNSNARPKKD